MNSAPKLFGNNAVDLFDSGESVYRLENPILKHRKHSLLARLFFDLLCGGTRNDEIAKRGRHAEHFMDPDTSLVSILAISRRFRFVERDAQPINVLGDDPFLH